MSTQTTLNVSASKQYNPLTAPFSNMITGIRITNESPFLLTITNMKNGGPESALAWSDNLFTTENGQFTGGLTINTNMISNQLNAPSSIVIITIYSIGDTLPSGNFPQSLSRVLSLGSNIPTVLTATQLIYNATNSASSPGAGSITQTFDSPPSGLNNYLTGLAVTFTASYNSNTYLCNVDIDYCGSASHQGAYTPINFYIAQTAQGCTPPFLYTFQYPVPQYSLSNNIRVIVSGYSNTIYLMVFGIQQP